MTRVHVLAIVAGILLPISGPSFATPQSRHPSSTHFRSAVEEDRGITSPSPRVPAFDPRGNFGLSIWSGVQLPLSGPPVWRPRSLVTLCDRETTGNGLQQASTLVIVMSALGQKQTFAVQKGTSALPPIATAKADMRKWSCPLYPPKADMWGATSDVCFGPKADITFEFNRDNLPGRRLLPGAVDGDTSDRSARVQYPALQAVTWPLIAHAQQTNNPFRIGYVPLGLPTNAADQLWVEAFRKGLGDVGLIESRDVTIDITWVANESDYSQAVVLLMQRGAMLLVTGGSHATAAA